MYVTINKHVKEQIATLLSTKYQIIKTHCIMDVQKQVGSSDCGLFTMANATALAYAIRPDTCWYDQGKMRQHLYECLQQEDLTQFLLRRERRSKEIKFSDNIKVFCICRDATNWTDGNVLKVPQLVSRGMCYSTSGSHQEHPHQMVLP